MAADQVVLYQKKKHTAYITINRPEKMNALNSEARRGLLEAFFDYRDDDELRVAILTGAGDKAFSSGSDLKEWAEIAQSAVVPELYKMIRRVNLYEAVNEIYKPIIVAINGVALGGGCELAISCDIRVMADHAVIGLPEPKRGLVGNFGTIKLSRMLPRAVATQMLFTGEPLSAEDALRWGLVNKVVSLNQLIAAAEEVAERILECGPLAIRKIKESIAKGDGLPLSYALRLNVGPDANHSEDGIEGAKAFNEKRKPIWRGR